MKKLLHYVPVAIGIFVVMGAILVTGGFFDSQPIEFAEDPQVHAQATVENERTTLNTTAKFSQKTIPVYTITRSTNPVDALATPPSSSSFAITTTTSPISTTTTTTKLTAKPNVGPSGRYSSMRVFLDLQRIIFYKVNPGTGMEYEAYAVKCSTGTRHYPTPTSRADKPFILGGRKAKLTVFSSTKSTVDCWVRYATHMSGSIWFHSVPYDYVKDVDGKGVFDPSRCYMYSGYDVLGKYTSSHGCIRLALRDANFVYNATYRGMPCYILPSYSAVYPGQNPMAPASLPPPLRGPRNWDPTDPEWPGYNPQPIATTAPAPTETTAPTEVPPSTEPTVPTTTMTETETSTTLTETPTTTTASTTTSTETTESTISSATGE